MSRVGSWFGRVLRRDRVERDLDEELRFHVQSRTEHWRALGLTDADARRRAHIEFGGVERVKDESRQSLGLRLLDELRADLRYAARRLGHARAFSAVAVLVLGVTIGATAAVFSVLDAVMLRWLPVHEPQALREFAWVQPPNSTWKMQYDGSSRPFSGGGLISTSFSYPLYTTLRDRTTTFSDLFLLKSADVTLGVAGRPQRAAGLVVTGNFFPGVGVSRAEGRLLSPSDDQDSAPPAVVISHGLWRRAFGERPDVVGQPVTINDRPATIVGVTPASFVGVDPGTAIDVYLPLAAFLPVVGESDPRAAPEYWAFRMMGRVRPEADAGRVAAEMDALARQALPPQYASDPSGFTGMVVRPGGQGSDFLRRNYSQQLYLLLGIVAATLLVACGNIAGLMLARTAGRVREVGMRMALGAARGRVVRQVLAESALLALAGTAFGAGVALVVQTSVLPFLTYDDGKVSVPLGIDGSLLLFLSALFVAVTLLCGLLPAWRATSGVSLDANRTETGTAEGGRRLFAGRTLIAVQVTLSMVLLAGAGLLVRSLQNLQAEPLGFRPEGVLLFGVDGTESGYADTALKDLYERIGDRLAATPGVEAASFSRHGLLSGGATTDSVVIPGAPQGADEIRVHVHHVSPGHFETLGIPMRAGRDFLPRDRETAPRVAIANEALAKLLPGEGLPIGRNILYDSPDSPIEIVGLVADARFATLRQAAPPTLYLPYRQHRQHVMTFALRTSGDPALLAVPVRRVVEEIEPKLAIQTLRTQVDQINESVGRDRAFAYIASGCAVLAAFLACLGLYGTLSYAVAGRTREIGLRVALGASRGQILSMVMRQSIAPTVVGVGAGLLGAALTTRYVESMLFGLSARDPATLVVAAAALVGSALLAAWIPSRRAARVDPAVALRAE